MSVYHVYLVPLEAEEAFNSLEAELQTVAMWMIKIEPWFSGEVVSDLN